MATAAPAATTPRAGASEATIMFHNEPWTAEVARLLLEVDEGWVGYRGDAAWSWHDETYTAFVAVCGERQWPANSRGACMAMLHALRTGAISMKLSSATRSPDGCAQWSLVEMRKLGAQMRRVVDGKVPTARWAAQLLIFVDAMKGKDTSYSIEDRSIEEFALRAGKFLPEPILRFIDPNGDNGRTPQPAVANNRNARRAPTPEPEDRHQKATPPVAVTNTRNPQSAPTPEPEERQKRPASQKRQTPTKDDDRADEPLVPVANARKAWRAPEPDETRRVTKGQSMTRATRDEDSEDEPLVPRRRTRSRSRNNSDHEQRRHTRSQDAAGSTTQIKKRGRKRSVESEGDSSYHDPTSEEDGDAFWDAALQLSETKDDIVATQELTSQGELLPAEQPTPPTQATVNRSRPSQDEPHAERPSSASSQVRASSQDPPVEAQPSPRQDPPVEQPASSHEDPQLEERPSPRENPRAVQQTSPRQDPEGKSPRESNQGQKRRQDSADQTRTVNVSQCSDSPTRQPSRKYRRVQNNERMHSNGRASSSSSSSLFRSLNPYDRPGKPWGEFVVEVLLAERTARNEDELDYVQFVRGLFEI